MRGDLFEFLDDAGRDGAPAQVCALMPNMMTACGRCTCGGCGSCPCGNACLTQPTPHVTTHYDRVTCSDCLAYGREDLHRTARDAQRRQAPVTS